MHFKTCLETTLISTSFYKKLSSPFEKNMVVEYLHYYASNFEWGKINILLMWDNNMALALHLCTRSSGIQNALDNPIPIINWQD
jgi:hypothetical protein